MKRLATAIAAIALIGTPASAADMAVKAPPPAPPLAPVSTWAGWYIGLNAGGGWGNNGGIDNSVTSSFCLTGVGGCPPFGLDNSPPGYGAAIAQAVPLI
jgi:outer membrane immunogenic protein